MFTKLYQKSQGHSSWDNQCKKTYAPHTTPFSEEGSIWCCTLPIPTPHTYLQVIQVPESISVPLLLLSAAGLDDGDGTLGRPGRVAQSQRWRLDDIVVNYTKK